MDNFQIIETKSEEIVRAVVCFVIYKKDETGYAVISAKDSDTGEKLIMEGNFVKISEGENIKAHGNYTTHPKYGEQFKVSFCEVELPEDAEAMEQYLASGLIKGIGKVTAKNIVKKFGSDTKRILEEEPDKLVAVKGISKRKAQLIGERIKEKSKVQNAVMYLLQFKISPDLAIKLYKVYEERLYAIIVNNPYDFIEKVRGISFKRADDIARKVGIDENSPHRIKSGIMFVLSEARLKDGHVFLPKANLIGEAKDLLRVNSEFIEREYRNMIANGDLYEEDEAVYSRRDMMMEKSIASDIASLCCEDPTCPSNVESIVMGIEEANGIELDEVQRDAVIRAAKENFLVITGGPGTGKTSTINILIKYLKSQRKTIALAAPTGRASKRMSEVTNMEASTIHRLLEVGYAGESEELGFQRNENNPLDEDVVIIDEVSMVDMSLMYHLLRALRSTTKLILVGDKDQLPSVGSGSILRDILKSEVCPCVMLTKIFRQAENSDIIMNSHRMLKGEPLVIKNNKTTDFFFYSVTDNRELTAEKVINLVKKSLPQFTGYDSYNIQVLCATKEQVLGVNNLNARLQEAINPPDVLKSEYMRGETCFREGDKVMQTKNNYAMERAYFKDGKLVTRVTGVFNGDVGIIERIDNENEYIYVRFEDESLSKYEFKMADELQLAYAVTVHKSQGSEYPVVIIPIGKYIPMLTTMNHMYTAVTRAKRYVVLVGDPKDANCMIQNRTEAKRHTKLAERLRAEVMGYI